MIPCLTREAKQSCTTPDFRDILEHLEHAFQLRQHSPGMTVKPHRLPEDDETAIQREKPPEDRTFESEGSSHSTTNRYPKTN